MCVTSWNTPQSHSTAGHCSFRIRLSRRYFPTNCPSFVVQSTSWVDGNFHTLGKFIPTRACLKKKPPYESNGPLKRFYHQLFMVTRVKYIPFICSFYLTRYCLVKSVKDIWKYFLWQTSSNISIELCFWRPDKQKVEWRPSCGGVLYLLREICGSLPQLVAVSFCPLDGTCSRFCLRVFGRKLLLQSTLMKAMNRKWVSGTTQREVIINPLVNYKGESHSHLTQAFESRQF